MNIIFGLLLAILNFRLLFKNKNKGLVLFSILMVVSPVFCIGDVVLYYSYVFLPFLIFWHFCQKSYKTRYKALYIPLVIEFIWVIFVTIMSAALNKGDSINYFSIIGTLRYLIIFYILSNYRAIKEKFLQIIGGILFINCVAMIAEFALLNIWSHADVVSLWMKLWGTIGNLGSLNDILELGGTVGRLHGTFTTSAFPGTLSVLGLGLFLVAYFEKRSWTSILFIILSLFCGLASSSKRFFLGAVFIVIFAIILKSMYIKKSIKGHDYKLPLLILLSIISLSYFYSSMSDTLFLDYYIQYLLEGNLVGSMDTRFGEEGVVNSMLPYINENLFMGCGEISILGILVTDSEFYVTLFKGGLIALSLYILYFCILIKHVFANKNAYVWVVFSIILFEYIISTEFYSGLGILLLSFVGSSINFKHSIHKNGK